MILSGHKFKILIAAPMTGLALLVWLLWPTVPDFSEFPTGGERKQAFINYFVPLIHSANNEVLQDRTAVLALRSRATELGFFDRRSLYSMAEKYTLPKFDETHDKDWQELLKRINAVPPSLALAQAAKESGWGTSRFAQEGNNYFGQWCFEPGCGLVPKDRAQGKSHEVAKFSSPAKSVEAYINNLNRNSAYEKLRSIRAQTSAPNRIVSGSTLAAGLLKYSERGPKYVDEIRDMIRANKLEQYDDSRT